jgi:hypothetical protein
MKSVLIVSTVALMAVGSLAAQERGRGTSGSAAAKAVKTTPVRVAVRDKDGATLEGVHIALSGDVSGDFTTAGAGTAILPNMKDGNYRMRLERKGYVTLEREFAIHAGAPAAVDVTLTPEPPAPPPPPPPPPAPAKKLPPPGPPVSLSVIDFFEKNFIGAKDPLKESVVACTPFETVRLLQIREPVVSHSHDDADEILYVVAGEGAADLGGQTVQLRPGEMVVVPRASAHAFERKGKNPLMVISTFTGVPCQEPAGSK